MTKMTDEMKERLLGRQKPPEPPGERDKLIEQLRWAEGILDMGQMTESTASFWAKEATLDQLRDAVAERTKKAQEHGTKPKMDEATKAKPYTHQQLMNTTWDIFIATPKAKAVHRMVMTTILKNSWSRRYCEEWNTLLEKESGCSPATLTRALDYLENKLGWIKRQFVNRGKTRIHIVHKEMLPPYHQPTNKTNGRSH